MRKVAYVFADGTKVYSMRETQAIGKPYTVELEQVETERTKLSPIREAMISQFGYVHPSLKDKVVL